MVAASAGGECECGRGGQGGHPAVQQPGVPAGGGGPCTGGSCPDGCGEFSAGGDPAGLEFAQPLLHGSFDLPVGAITDRVDAGPQPGKAKLDPLPACGCSGWQGRAGVDRCPPRCVPVIRTLKTDIVDLHIAPPSPGFFSGGAYGDSNRCPLADLRRSQLTYLSYDLR